MKKMALYLIVIIVNFFAVIIGVLPFLTCILCYFNIVSLITGKILLAAFFVLFVLVPLIFKYCYKLQTSAVFLNFVQLPYNADYAHPHKYGLHDSRNFYLKTDDDITLGVWQILPIRTEDQFNDINETDDRYFEDALSNERDVIIYFHGNAGSRLSGHRIELYKILRKHFHVIAFDYRSYGDSTNDQPSENKLVKDCMFMFNWVANRTNGNIYIWGHSLGTSLTIHALSILQKKDIAPTGVILEAPFNNLREEISEFPLARMFRFLPWFNYMFTEPLQENGFTFKTDRYICDVDAPILILHAQDDYVVPIRLGKKLYEEGKRCRRDIQGALLFHEFEGKFGYEHKYICRSPEIDEIIRNFVSLTKGKIKEESILT